MILGAVLAGGRSSRFGSDKSQAVWNGRPLIDHVVARLATVSDTVVVCGRAYDHALSLQDRPLPDLGPLGGLNAALHHASTTGYDRVIAAPCDAPLLDDDLLALLAAAEGDLFLADMPVIGSWRGVHAARLDAHLLADGNRSMRGWAEATQASPLHRPAPPNINRPADLEKLDRA